MGRNAGATPVLLSSLCHCGFTIRRKYGFVSPRPWPLPSWPPLYPLLPPCAGLYRPPCRSDTFHGRRADLYKRPRLTEGETGGGVRAGVWGGAPAGSGLHVPVSGAEPQPGSGAGRFGAREPRRNCYTRLCTLYSSPGTGGVTAHSGITACSFAPRQVGHTSGITPPYAVAPRDITSSFLLAAPAVHFTNQTLVK